MSGAQWAVPSLPEEEPRPYLQFWEGNAPLSKDLDRVQARLVSEAAQARGAIGDALVRYVGRRGKMLRPGLAIVGSWAGTARPDRPARTHIVEIAAAIETLHLASLIHDDVIDEADRRRGEPSLHALYGNRQAVLMGDFLLSRCFTMISRKTKRENALRLAAATGHLVQGEISQMMETGEPRFSRRAYFRRIAGKTAMLFGLGLVVGAHESKAKEREIALLARAGYCMGMAFQIIDDILDFSSTVNGLGKPVARDLAAGIYTLPVIEAVRTDSSIKGLLIPPPASNESLSRAVEAVRTGGGLDEARALAARYTVRARRAISSLAEPTQRATLMSVAEKLLIRDY